jgi:hypothetical protein
LPCVSTLASTVATLVLATVGTASGAAFRCHDADYNVTTANGAKAALAGVEGLIQTAIDAAASFGSARAGSTRRCELHLGQADRLAEVRYRRAGRCRTWKKPRPVCRPCRCSSSWVSSRCRSPTRRRSRSCRCSGNPDMGGGADARPRHPPKRTFSTRQSRSPRPNGPERTSRERHRTSAAGLCAGPIPPAHRPVSRTSGPVSDRHRPTAGRHARSAPELRRPRQRAA